MTRDDMLIALGHLDRSLRNLKRRARDQFGSRRASWPEEIRMEIDRRKEQAKDYRRLLGLRKD